jgi:nitrate reductase NapE component
MYSKVKSQKSKVKRHKYFFLLPIAYCLMPIASKAQCAMCRAALESNENTVQAEAVNDGIVFLMIMPYILVALVGFAVYKLKYAKKKR